LNNSDLIDIRQNLKDVDSLMQRGIHTNPDSNLTFFTGYEYGTLYDWDMYFESIVQIYMGWPGDYIKNGVTIFLNQQLDNGFILRSAPGHDLWANEHCKPFLAQNAILYYRAYGSLDFLDEPLYQRLRKFIAYWLNDMDSTGNGLSEWLSAPHTGMDNHHERTGHWNDRVSQGVDINCYLYRELQAMALIASLRHNEKDRQYYLDLAQNLRQNINTLLWDDTAGFYYDRHIRDDKLIPVTAVSGLLPLWAGVAPVEHARVMVDKYLHNSRRFWTPYPLPALARSEPGYSQTPFDTDVLGPQTCSWRANTWLPTNYMVYHGLKNYGFHDIAADLAARSCQMVKASGNCEWYDAENGSGHGLNPFWGWSLLAHFLPFEEDSSFDISALTLE